MPHPLASPLLFLSLLAVPAAASAQQSEPALKEERPGLLARAKIAPDSARAIAVRAVPGGKVTKAELEEERGRLVYSFDLVLAGQRGVEEVLVDARTGTVISREHEDAAAEAAEQRRDSTTRP